MGISIVHVVDQKFDRFLSCVFMQNGPEKRLMTFLIENKTFLTLETKIKVNPQILVISGKIRQDFLDLKKKKKKTAFLRLHKQSDKKVEKVRFFQMGWSMLQLVKDIQIFHVFIQSKIGQENAFDDIREKKTLGRL